MARKLLFHRKSQTSTAAKLQRQGYKHTTISHLGAEFERIDPDGFVDKVVVTLYGRVKKFKPSKPNNYQEQTLPKMKTKYSYLNEAFK